MTENEFRKILCEAMNEECRWISQFEEHENEHSFSPEFEKKMQRLLQENTAYTKEYDVVSKKNAKSFDGMSSIRVGRHTFRKMTVIIVAATMILILASFTAIYLSITWNEKKDDKKGTLDVTFGIEGNKNTHQGFEAKMPTTPQKFEIVEKNEAVNGMEMSVLYQNNDEQIYYSQEIISENTGLSIDNDDESFTEITINGCKGYAVKEGSSPFIIWCDGKYLYYINGTVSYEILEEMAKSVR